MAHGFALWSVCALVIFTSVNRYFLLQGYLTLQQRKTYSMPIEYPLAP
jgi:hypothetical protein